jgi:hypothetical protein
MSRQSHTATPRGTRRTIMLIAMLAAALLAPSAAASTRQKFFHLYSTIQIEAEDGLV